MILPNSVESIGKFAFADCGKLSRVDIPVASVEIDPDAFTNSLHLTVFASKGGTVENFAKDQGVSFVALPES